jgi:hypothetical protein
MAAQTVDIVPVKSDIAQHPVIRLGKFRRVLTGVDQMAEVPHQRCGAEKLLL